MVIQVCALTSNAEEAEVERFYEDLQDLLELKPKKGVPFIIGDWNAKVGSQEIPGVTCKFGLRVQNKAGQNPTDAGNLISDFSAFSKSSLNIHGSCTVEAWLGEV